MSKSSKKFLENILHALHILILMRNPRGVAESNALITPPVREKKTKTTLNVIKYFIWEFSINSWKLTRMHARIC